MNSVTTEIRPVSDLLPPPIASSSGRVSSDYADLKAQVKQAGLLEKQVPFYIGVAGFLLALMGLSLYVAATLDFLWVQALNGAFMAVVFAQLGFYAHDAGHLQIFRSPHRNYLAMLGVGFLMGLSPSWWLDKHNNHHVNPNDVDLDLDINLPVIAFNREQAVAKKGLARLIVKYQAFLFFPLLLIEALSIRADSAQFILRGKNVKYRLAEALAIVGHFAIYFWLVFQLMTPMSAMVFVLVHQALIGVYMGSVFAPNHKGMLLLDRSTKLDFLRRQVLTSRNIRGNLFIDFLYGGLNYQIEHHLFPTIPRNRLASVRPIVRRFCRERDVPYHETGMVSSWREVLGHLDRVSSCIRGSSNTPAAATDSPGGTGLASPPAGLRTMIDTQGD